MHWFEQETSFRWKAQRSERQVVLLVVTVAFALGAVLLLGMRGILLSQAEHREVQRSAKLGSTAADVKIRTSELTEWEHNFSTGGPLITSVASRSTFMTSTDHLERALRALRASTDDTVILNILDATQHDYERFQTLGITLLSGVGKKPDAATRSAVEELRTTLGMMQGHANELGTITDTRRVTSALASDTAANHATRLFIAAGIVAGLLLALSCWLGIRVVRLHRFALDQMAAIAATDPLTGLANRRTWDHTLPEEFLRTARSGAPITIAMIDIDKFKNFNDSYGHGAGDDLLRAVGGALRGGVRATDLAARLGGEEFGLMFFNSEPEACLAAIDAIRLNIPRGQTFSVGLAQWDGRETPIEVTVRADKALYAAKENGRNRAAISLRDDDFRIALPAAASKTGAAA